jgi:hypothetical protein
LIISVFFAHLFLVGAKNGAMALPASLLLIETNTVHSCSSARLILLFAQLVQRLFWSVEQLLVMFWLGFEENACCVALLLLMLLLKHHSFNDRNAIAP